MYIYIYGILSRCICGFPYHQSFTTIESIPFNPPQSSF